MKKLIDCGNKVIGKLVSREDLDMLAQEARNLEAEGLTPIEAERQAVRDALDQVTQNGENILRQIRAQRPQAYKQALNFWEKETIRKAGMVPPPLPRFVTEGMPPAPAPAAPALPADAIVASHNANGGSTVNSVHGDLAFTNSFSVSIFPDLTTTVPGKNITPEQIHAFAAKVQAAGVDTGSPNISIGTWYDAESNTTYLDVAFTTTDRAQAVALGQQFNQKAIFDLNAMEEIATGGTGTVEGGLPSIEERLGMASSLGYVPPREGTAQATTAPGTPAPAEAGVPGGAQGGISEAGGVQEEGQPGQVTPPLSDAAQEAVNSLPEEQRSAAQRAFTQTDYDPLADMQRRRGDPVSKPAGKPASPEKNTKLVADASKYGLFEGKTPSEVLSAIAGDPKQPRWKRLVADLLVQLGIGDGVTIRAVNNPNASWAGVYNSTRSEVLINLAFGGATRPDLATRIIHELVHHGTMAKLDTENEADLTPSELAARDELQKIFDYVRSQPEFEGMYGTVALREFVSEIFANEALRNKLNSIKPDGKVSLWQRFTDAVLKFLIGDRLPGMRKGSLLEKAIAEALNVAGSPMAEGPSDPEVAAQEARTRAARLINAFPTFQEHILNSVAPTVAPLGGELHGISEEAYRYGWTKNQSAFNAMLEQYPQMRNELVQAYGKGVRGGRALVAPMVENNMGITEAETRERDHEAAFYSDAERKAIEADVDKMAKGINATKAEIKAVKDRIGTYIKYYRATNPAKAGWANSEIKPVGLDEDYGLKRGKVTKANPTGITFKVKFAKSPFTFARDAAKKLIPRFLKQSKADAAAGKPLVDNPEWAKRRQELGDKMFDDLREIMSRRNEGGDKGRIAQVILDQINWYRDMREHLRVTFGSMSDYVADVIAGLSPITDVPGNWANFIEYFEGVMKGRYDDLYRKFDAYVSEDPENRNASTWRTAGGELPLKLNKAKFGTNGPNVMMAGLDLWRAVQTGTAPKARNFGLNLIGQSLKATIDRWAGRYLQRMHAPTWRLPAMIEADVKGEHMPGENVDLVSGDFGMGQDVFEDVAKRLQKSGIPEFKNVTAADLQAILWFAEKEVWEMKGWTQIMGAGSSMNALAQATAAQRYEAGTMPGVFSKDKQLTGEIIGLRNKINGESHVLGAKMVPSVNIHDGEESKTFDGEWITHPEYDPTNTISHVAEAAARLGKDGAHISRVIVNPYEANPNRTPGLHIFFRGRVGDAEVKGVLAKLKDAGITNGISLAVDPRVRPEIVKSLDPAMGANQYNGVRVQYIPEYGAAGGMTRDQIEQAFADVKVALDEDANIAESRVLYYDTLVLKKDTDYDSSGKLTKNVSDGRGKAWTERARREGSEAATRRDNARKAIADRKRADSELELRIKREEEERIARYEAFQRSQPVPDAAIDGGVDPPSVAAMELQDETQPTRDPHGGRASLVRSMVNRIANAARGQRGGEIPSQPGQEVRAPAGARRGAAAGGERSAAVWRAAGETFRKREAALSRRLEEAAKLTEEENPSEGKYAVSQRLFDYLTGKRAPTDLELRDAVMELRREVPTIPSSVFGRMQDLDSGVEADVYHDPEGGLVYKLYRMKEGQFGGKNVGPLRRRSDGEIVASVGERTDFRDLIGRMERSNTHGLTPTELVAVTPEGDLVFAQPYIDGRGVTGKNIRPALARAGIHLLSEMGAVSGVAKLPDGRWVLYDDLHPGNVRTMPGGRVEIIDALNRELDSYEIADLHALGKMPAEKPLGVPKAPARKKVQKYSNAVVVAPMVETYHGTPHDWKPETKIRTHNGTVRWIVDDEEPMPKGAEVIDTAPAGRVRGEKVGAGEGHAAFGWGVLYSAQERKVAEGYQKQLSNEAKGEWFLNGTAISDLRGEEWFPLKQGLELAVPYEEFWHEGLTDLRQMARTEPRYQQMVDALEKHEGRLEYRKGAGNVYTVQLDVNDPELLDWFMPMNEQAWVVDNVLKHFGQTRESALKAHEHNEMLADIANDLESRVSDQMSGVRRTELSTPELQNRHAMAEREWAEDFKKPEVRLGQFVHRMDLQAQAKQRWASASQFTGEKFYTILADMMRSKQAASELLNSVGVPGIVFLDQESRFKPQRNFRILEWAEGGWMVLEGAQRLATFASEEQAKAFAAAEQPKRTSNYVMFDPEKIKVVGKNGEVVKTAAADLPPAPRRSQTEQVTVAAMPEEGVKDGTDLSVAPMAGRGRRTRQSVSAENYKPAGWTAPFKRLSWEVVKFAQQKRQMEAATTYRVQTMVKDFERKVKKVYKGKPSPEENKNIMMALGNLDNRLTQTQAQEAMKMRGAEREGFLHTAHMENVARFKQEQERALNSLPDEIREAVNMLREELDLEAKETLKDTGLDTELRARLDANQGVFLHSNAFQHFEDDVWGKRIKSDHPEAQRVRRAAEDLFRNEIIGENAFAYQKEQKAKGIDVSDEDALRLAAASGDLDQQIATRLDDYLRKETDEPSRLHMLMGKMPVTRTDAGKMLSLDRENIPKEIRDLWGQYDDPATNFAKTLSILAGHNAQTRMQNAMLEDGLEKGYFWQQGVSSGPRPPGLVQMTTDTRGPMVGVHGPPALKEGLSLMNQRPVRSLLSELNSVPLMMKTVGSIGSAVRNFFGNPLFMVSNGNLLISAVYWPKAFWLSLQRAADFMATSQGRKQLARMIELGVLDESVDAKILERIAKNARVGHKWEGQAGFGASIAAAQRGFIKAAEKTMIPFQKVYTMADNFWRLANYNVELLRQGWMNPELSLEQQEENAAEITRRTLPTYSNIIEGFRESYGKVSEIAAPYLSFQAEAVRTYASSVHLAFKEISSGKPKEVMSGLWRLGGLMAATSAPLVLGMASKAMFGYDDDDEKAIRAGLPEYQRNNMLFFLPRGPKGEPRFLDLNFVNPYSLLHTAYTAAWRGTGLEGAFKQFAKPLVSLQPVAGLGTDIWTNKDSRGGGQIYDPYASGGEKAASILKRVVRDVTPGTVDSAIKIGEAYAGRDLFGNRLEKTGEKRDLREEVMKVFPGTADVSFDRDKAIQVHVNEYKTAARNASGLFDKKMSADGPVNEGEVAAAYKEADERSFRATQQMHEAYKGLLKLGMTPTDAIKQMRIGFGSEIRKGGLSKTALQQVVSGNYRQFMPSEQLLKETAFLHRDRIREFNEARQQQPRSRTASP